MAQLHRRAAAHSLCEELARQLGRLEAELLDAVRQPPSPTHLSQVQKLEQELAQVQQRYHAQCEFVPGPGPGSLPWLHTVGNEIQSEDGQRVLLRGANIMRSDWGFDISWSADKAIP